MRCAYLPAAFNFYFWNLEFLEWKKDKDLKKEKRNKEKWDDRSILTSRQLGTKDTFSFYRITIGRVANERRVNKRAE